MSLCADLTHRKRQKQRLLQRQQLVMTKCSTFMYSLCTSIKQTCQACFHSVQQREEGEADVVCPSSCSWSKSRDAISALSVPFGKWQSSTVDHPWLQSNKTALQCKGGDTELAHEELGELRTKGRTWEDLTSRSLVSAEWCTEWGSGDEWDKLLGG